MSGGYFEVEDRTSTSKGMHCTGGGDIHLPNLSLFPLFSRMVRRVQFRIVRLPYHSVAGSPGNSRGWGTRIETASSILSAFSFGAIIDKGDRVPVNCCFDWTASTFCSIIFDTLHLPQQEVPAIAGLLKHFISNFSILPEAFLYRRAERADMIAGRCAPSSFFSRRAFFFRVFIHSYVTLWHAKSVINCARNCDEYCTN